MDLSYSSLLVINPQKALSNPRQSPKSNQRAENNILELLKFFRDKKLPIIFIKHISESPASPFYRAGEGAEFLPLLTPILDEKVIEKNSSSIFDGTPLKSHLDELGVTQVFLVGFSGNDSIDASAKDAFEVGFKVYVVGDATAVFDTSGTDGKVYKSGRVLKLILGYIGALYGKIIDTQDLISLSK